MAADKSRGVFILIILVVGGTLWARGPVTAKARMRSYAVAQGEDRDRIAERLRADPDLFASGLRWGLRTPGVREAAVDLALQTEPADLPARVAFCAADLLRSTDGGEWAAAAEILSHLGERAIDALNGVLHGEGDQRVKTRAIAILIRAGDRGEDAVAGYYVRLFRHPDRSVRSKARRQLESMGPAATPRLVEALRDAVPEARIFAALTLGRVQDRRAVKALIDGLGDREEDLGVKAAIGDALLRITDQVEMGHDDDLWRRWWQSRQSRYPPQILPPTARRE